MVWILAFGIFWTAYTLSNILFGIFILISAFSISIFASRKPNLININLSSEKITIGNKIFNFESLESFWIENNKILLKSRKKISTYIIIPLNPEVDTEEIKEYLLERLKEEKLKESFFQILLEKIW